MKSKIARQKKWIFFIFLPLAFLWISFETIFHHLLFLPTHHQYPPFEQPISSNKLESVQKILAKPLHFLGLGAQCYAFETEDKKHVIKICKKTRSHKEQGDFASYFLAQTFLEEEGQLVFFHLHSTENLPSVKIVDPLGIPHFLNCDKYCFYIQKKLTPLSEIHSSNISEEILVEKLLDLCISTSHKAITMRDIQLKNIGWLDGKCVWLDLGKIRAKEKTPSSEESEKEFLRLISRLKKELVALNPHFEYLLEKALPNKIEAFYLESGT